MRKYKLVQSILAHFFDTFILLGTIFIYYAVYSTNTINHYVLHNDNVAQNICIVIFYNSFMI